MTRRTTALLTLLLALLTAIALSSGCAQEAAPQDDAPVDPVAATVAALESVEGYRYTLELDIETIDSRSTGTGTGVVSGDDESSEFESLTQAYADTGDAEMRPFVYETRIVDGEVYSRIIDPEAKQASVWMTEAPGLGPAMSQTDRWLDLIARGTEIEDLGSERWQGTSCRHMSMQVDASEYWAVVFGAGLTSDSAGAIGGLPADMGPPVPLEIWTGRDDALPRRLVITPPDEGLVDYTFDNWGAQDPIEVPADVGPWPDDAGVTMDRPWSDD